MPGWSVADYCPKQSAQALRSMRHAFSNCSARSPLNPLGRKLGRGRLAKRGRHAIPIQLHGPPPRHTRRGPGRGGPPISRSKQQSHLSDLLKGKTTKYTLVGFMRFSAFRRGVSDRFRLQQFFDSTPLNTFRAPKRSRSLPRSARRLATEGAPAQSSGLAGPGGRRAQ